MMYTIHMVSTTSSSLMTVSSEQLPLWEQWQNIDFKVRGRGEGEGSGQNLGNEEAHRLQKVARQDTGASK